jgi:hypothetical protein
MDPPDFTISTFPGIAIIGQDETYSTKLSPSEKTIYGFLSGKASQLPDMEHTTCFSTTTTDQVCDSILDLI